MSDTSLLRERLEQIGDEAGHLKVDVARARTRGRRILLLRQAAVTLGSAAVVGIVAVTVPGSIAGTDSAAPGTAAAGSPARSLSLVKTAAFGWLPAGISVADYAHGGCAQSCFSMDADSNVTGTKIPNPGVDIDLSDYGRGPRPALPPPVHGRQSPRIPASAVNGHPAYWIVRPVTGLKGKNFELLWQYRPHSWAVLQAWSFPATSTAAISRTAYKVARSVVFGLNARIALPLGVPSLPVPLKLLYSQLQFDPNGADLWFSSASDPSGLSIQASEVPIPVKANTRIAGHPAYYDQSAGELDVFGVRGYAVVSIGASRAVISILPHSGSLAWLFSQLTITASGKGHAAR